MDFGLFVSHDGTSGIAPAHVYRNAAEQVEYADEAGFRHVWFPEHHFVQRYLSPAPLLNCVDAARRTRRVRVGTSIILTPYHHPLILGEQIALADHLTDGRLEVGFARGASLYEAERIGLKSHLEAAQRQQESLDILLGAWGQDEDFAFQGQYYSFPPVWLLPRPLQQPHPPSGSRDARPIPCGTASSAAWAYRRNSRRNPCPASSGSSNSSTLWSRKWADRRAHLSARSAASV
jgi:alkanesulfonate monooxygenase SsuD/methylene tetrahydromethanopterin reductase-like flavin-dependent oxidoreductase (luciferase family)